MKKAKKGRPNMNDVEWLIDAGNELCGIAVDAAKNPVRPDLMTAVRQWGEVVEAVQDRLTATPKPVITTIRAKAVRVAEKPKRRGGRSGK